MMEEGLLKNKVVEYLDSSMSTDLLCKYADNSAFDFDYSQSSIWSPLVPRFHCLNPKSPDILNRRRLSFDKKPSFSGRIKKTICTFGLHFNAKITNNKKMLKFNNDSEFQSPPSNKKGWKKALKMTSKQFKKKKDNHSRHPISRVTLSDLLQSQNF